MIPEDSYRVSADVRSLVETALQAGASVDVTYEADGSVRVCIYPVEVSEKKEDKE